MATLDELYVRPGSRGQRHGHALLEAACRLARERGAGA
ncbi:GNAT family N-acetyltransferase [Micromonospora haikouensis]